MMRLGKMLLVAGLALLTITCQDKDDPAPTRTFRMGFQASAPRYDDFDLVVKTIRMWAEPGNVADAAMITTEVPWDALIEGKSAVDYVTENYSGLVAYYRTFDLELWVYIDPANGLNRTTDAQALVTRGKSIANEDMQKIYRRFVVVMDSMLTPDHLGLALETNLIRATSSNAIYSGVKKAANDVVSELKSRNSKSLLSVSVQADVAWGSLQKDFKYHGITQDLSDFSFVEELGISSYPYFGYSDPKDLPHDYYSRIKEEANLPVFVSEGSWTSASIDGPDGTEIVSNPSKQSDYILKQADMLNEAKAIGLFSLTFTDIDLTALPEGVDPSIQYFAYLGVVDKDLNAKPAFESWKKIFTNKFIP